MDSPPKDPITFRPYDADKEAIASIMQRNPYLTNTAQVLRYCLHVTDAMERIRGSVFSLENLTANDLEAIRRRILGR